MSPTAQNAAYIGARTHPKAAQMSTTLAPTRSGSNNGVRSNTADSSAYRVAAPSRLSTTTGKRSGRTARHISICHTFGQSLPRNAASVPPSTKMTDPTK